MVPDAPLSNPTASAATPPKVRSSPTVTRSSVAVKVEPKKQAPKVNAECPIFLQKTYHMIDTCDPDIACWSEDGETFVVKNTDVFEKNIIPQFFKHSKFTSFVRQLNFYGFRKIKYNDTIRIDPKLEAATANFWRFRHENFKRGRPDLLIEIKRHNNQSAAAAAEKPSDSSSSAVGTKSDKSSSMKSEVNDLKERISKMSKNIDDLTALVQNMQVKEEDVEGDALVGNKRKKLEFAAETTDMVVEEVTSSGLSDITFTPTNIFPSASASRQASMAGTSVSDEAFVDDLFNAFGEDGLLDLTGDTSTNDSQLPPRPSTPQLSEDESDRAANNRPDPQLMDKLSDALALLPKEMQEMLVNRLILTIMSTDSMKGHLDAVSSASKASVVERDDAKREAAAEPQSQQTPPLESNPEIALPLAAATLGALLSQYTASMKDNNSKAMLTKCLPLIPAH